MKPSDNAVINLEDCTITFRAMPYPLPQAFRDELINVGKSALKARQALERKESEERKEEYEDFRRLLDATERRMRATIGFEYQRAYFVPTNEFKERLNNGI